MRSQKGCAFSGVDDPGLCRVKFQFQIVSQIFFNVSDAIMKEGFVSGYDSSVVHISSIMSAKKDPFDEVVKWV